MEAPASGIRIRQATIEYEFDGRLFKLTIPVTTAINSIYFDHAEADIAREAIGSEWGEPKRLDPDGSNWADLDREGRRLSLNVESLEVISQVAWSAEHTKEALCIHDERCGWYCVRR